MSYKQNLGRVKGDKGQVYVPSETINGKQTYITWELQDNASEVQPFDITRKVYVPYYDDTTGILSFTLTDAIDAITTINIKNIKGDKGDPGQLHTVHIKDGQGMPENPEENTIFLFDDGTPLIFADGDYFPLDSVASLTNYYTKSETDGKIDDKTMEINRKIGDIEACQNQIIYRLDNSVNLSNAQNGG